jgi:trigger factor
MSSALKTTLTELPESRVRVEAEVPPQELDKRMTQTARQLGKDLKMPGFRQGKVPPPVVIQRVGREAVLDETVRSALGRWYLDAIDDAGIKPVGDPDLNIGDLPPEGEPLTFTIEIGVRPVAELGTFEGVEVARREPAADEEAVQGEIDALREKLARLESVSRPAQTGDFVVMDYLGKVDDVAFEGGEGRDQLLELGSGRLIPGFEEGLTGAAAGEDRDVDVTFPDEYPAEHLAGKAARFAVTVKDVQEKIVPELDDAFAVDAAGFDTMDELREDIVNRLRSADEQKVEAEFREAVLDAVVAEAKVDVPDTLVDARAQELWERMTHTLSHQGIDKDTYLRISGKTEEEILEEAKPDAAQALRREAVIAAVVAAKDIQPSDGDVLDALQASAEREGVAPEGLRDQLEKSGRIDEVKDDIAQRQAVDLLAESAVAKSVDEAPDE